VRTLAEGAQAVLKLQARFKDAVTEAGSFRDQHWAVIDAKRWLEVAGWLRDDESTDYNVLVDITAVHWPHRDPPVENRRPPLQPLPQRRAQVEGRVGDAGPIASLTRFGSRRTGTSARRSTCSASCSRATPTCAGS